jgi:molecular chaperone GrpE
MTDANANDVNDTPFSDEQDLEQAATDILNAELEALKAENVALKEQALRYAAEAENIKRRAEREMNDARAYAIQKFAQSLLGVADIFQRALGSTPVDITDPAFKNFVAGIEMTEKELAGAFERNGVKKIAPMKGDKFDPNLHQAVTEQPADDVPNGSVLMLMQTGYELFGRIIRPAMVAVAKSSITAAPHANGVDTQA